MRMVHLLVNAILFFALILDFGEANAEPKSFKLSAPEQLVKSGLLKHLLPRFSLKTGIRIQLVEENAQANFNTRKIGRRIFSGLGEDWYFEPEALTHKAVIRFNEWLASDIGQKTISSFKPEGILLFQANLEVEAKTVSKQVSGDAIRGEFLSQQHCGRCHSVNEKTRLSSIGSTPSFALIRALPDWENKFLSFYVRKPHPAFTMVENVTPPFDPSRPSPISPLVLSLGDIDSMYAYISSMQPLDLGAPLQVK